MTPFDIIFTSLIFIAVFLAIGLKDYKSKKQTPEN
jgi:hypothetical protein